MKKHISLLSLILKEKNKPVDWCRVLFRAKDRFAREEGGDVVAIQKLALKIALWHRALKKTRVPLDGLSETMVSRWVCVMNACESLRRWSMLQGRGFSER